MNKTLFLHKCLIGLLAFTTVSTGAAVAQAPADAPPPAVKVRVIVPQAVSEVQQFISRIEAIDSVDLTARVEGVLERRLVDEGKEVKVGDLIFEIEKDRYEIAVSNARATLEGALAQEVEATASYKRGKRLTDRGAASKAILEERLAARDTARAGVSNAQAALDDALLDLRFTQIISPISGRIGAEKVSVGNVVSAATGPLATINQLDPIRAVFGINGRDFIETRLEDSSGSVDGLNAQFIPQIILPNGALYEYEGKIAFIDNQINASTGSLTIWAEFPNPKRILLPGQSLNVTVKRSGERRLPVVPDSAIQQDREGSYVLILNTKNVVERRNIKRGIATKGGTAVSQGLVDGDTVIVGGLLKVKIGAPATAIVSKASGE